MLLACWRGRWIILPLMGAPTFAAGVSRRRDEQSDKGCVTRLRRSASRSFECDPMQLSHGIP